VRWLTRRFKRRRDRFLLLSPPLLAHQRLYDRVSGSTSSLFIRDGEDFKLIEQIFIVLDYDFAKLQRAPDIAAFHDRIVAQGRRPLIIDAGANIGLATRFFHLNYPRAEVIAFEPDAGNLALARRNNPQAGARFVAAGVGSEDMRGRLVDPGSGHCGYRIEPAADGPVHVVSLDGVVQTAERDGLVPFIAKIDIEGFERDLFSRRLDWIDRFPVLIIELHDWMLPGSGSALPFLRAVAERDRDFVFHGENVFSLSNTLLQRPTGPTP
jgi:FkbM family methyltransferase